MFEKLCALIAEQFGVDADAITKDTAFVDELGADSVDLVDLSMALEEAGPVRSHMIWGKPCHWRGFFCGG